MLLPDGRKLVTASAADPEDPSTLRIHEDFCVWILANRPGFPFLGYNFFNEADLYSIHVVDNPGVDSEIELLTAYGPSVEGSIIARLANAFAELRQLVQENKMQYPYSTRESVEIVKHVD